jgi:D-aminopeptidase
MPQEAPVLQSFEVLNGEYLDPLYLAAVEAVEEAVVNAMVAGEDVATVKPEGKIVRALDTERLRRMFAA